MQHPHRTARLWFETLESRLTPSVSVRFDYSLDSSGLFNDPAARAAVERAGAAVTARMTDSLAAVSPSGSNTWTAQVYDSAVGTTRNLPGLSVGADEVVVYVTGGALGAPLAIASGGAYSARGSQSWLDTIRTRGQGGVDSGSDFAPWGGLVAFNTTTNWDFTAGTPAANQYDFDSVALHELMHVFGFGLNNPSFTRYTNGGYFTGPSTASVYGGSVPMQLGEGSDHFTAGTRYAGQEAVMNPAIAPGTAKRMTELEYATLRDVGWGTGGTTVPPTVTVPPVVAVPTTPSPVTGLPTAAGDRFAVSADQSASGSVSVYNGSGALVSQSPGLSQAGGTQVATGDVDGDGVADTVYGAAANDLPLVTVVSGRTGATIATFLAYEEAFRGGVNVAVGHVTGGTRADIIVGANTGGGPRVRVFAGGNPSAVVADFWGIEDNRFRGGVRVAVGDFDADGRDDLAVSAALGGGPRVAMYTGQSLAANRPQKFAGDFFAFAPTFAGGTYLTAADLNGDGYDDLIVGAGDGGGPHVRAFSGQALVRGRTTEYVADFFSGDTNYRKGVRVAATDLNGDGNKELITAPAPGTDGTVRVYSGTAFRGSLSATPYLQVSRPEWVASGAFVG
jgi:hypothetical protein